MDEHYAAEDDVPGLADLVFGMVGAAMDAQPEDSELVGTVIVESMTMELPVELYVRANGSVVSTPPRQKIETTILPVWHRLKLRVVEDHAS
jgi:hypothetical protein